MNDNRGTDVKIGTSFGEGLSLLLIALKLCGIISWSWIWVLAPVWMGAIIVLIILLIVWIRR